MLSVIVVSGHLIGIIEFSLKKHSHVGSISHSKHREMSGTERIGPRTTGGCPLAKTRAMSSSPSP